MSDMSDGIAQGGVEVDCRGAFGGEEPKHRVELTPEMVRGALDSLSTRGADRALGGDMEMTIKARCK